MRNGIDLMTDEMTIKLRNPFDSLFGTKKSEKEKGESINEDDKEIINIKIIPIKPKVEVGNELPIKVTVTKGKDNIPIPNAELNYEINQEDNKKIEIINRVNNTNDNGETFINVKGKEEGLITFTFSKIKEKLKDEKKEHYVKENFIFEVIPKRDIIYNT